MKKLVFVLLIVALLASILAGICACEPPSETDSGTSPSEDQVPVSEELVGEGGTISWFVSPESLQPAAPLAVFLAASAIDGPLPIGDMVAVAYAGYLAYEAMRTDDTQGSVAIVAGAQGLRDWLRAQQAQANASAAEGEGVNANEGTTYRGVKIAFIDDDKEYVESCDLEDVWLPGSTVTYYANCQLALGDPNLSTHHIAVVDYHMGAGNMNGIACVRELTGRIPFIILHSSNARVKNGGIQAGADAFVRKGKLQLLVDTIINGLQ